MFEKKYRQRFCVLFLYSLAQIMSSAAWLCFAAIFHKLVFVFSDNNEVKFKINYLSWVYMLAFIPINFFANWVIELRE